MNYRYQLYRPAKGIRKKMTIEDCMDDCKSYDADDIRNRLSAAFPTLQWHQVPDLDSKPWFGENDTVSVQFSHEHDGAINYVLLNDCAADDVRKACKALDAAAVDAASDSDAVVTA
jgi:hypothetical protein